MRFTFRTDQIWPLIILAGFCFILSLIPIPPNDFWWHLKIGELIYTQGSIPSTNMFAWTINANSPFIYGAWLGDWLLYLVYHLGKLELVILARTCLVLFSFWLVTAESQRKSNSWRIASLSLSLLACISLNNQALRPQIWAWPLFIAYLVLLTQYTEGKISRWFLLVLPILMAAWVNIHGSFILGGILVGVFFVGEALQVWVNPKSSLPLRDIGWIIIIGALCGFAMLINPQGLGSIKYVMDLMTDLPSQSLIIEWQSPSPSGIPNITFFASILLFIIAITYTRTKPKPTEMLLSLSFIWLAWTGMRYVIWYGFVVLPIMARMLANLPLRVPSLPAQRNWINNLIVVMIFLPSIFVQPWIVEKFPLPEKYWDQVIRGSPAGPLVSTATPVYAVDYLKNRPGGKLFNEMGYGSYLIWALPGMKVFIDPRVELFSLKQWEDYIDISNGFKYNEILTKYGADRILLDKILQQDLSEVLASDSTWILEYQDTRAQIWQRK